MTDMTQTFGELKEKLRRTEKELERLYQRYYDLQAACRALGREE